jgi:hypothetical protein
LESIASRASSAVIVIDDFQVPDDSGYGFDRYGKWAINVNLLPTAVGDWLLGFPKASSSSETGSVRGCSILFTPGLEWLASQMNGLRIQGRVSEYQEQICSPFQEDD